MKKPRIGLVLSGGSARGLAHIGLIKVLEENGIRPTVIAANSMGGIIGAMYAKNLDIKTVEEYINDIHMTDFVKLFDFSMTTAGIFKGEKFKKILQGYIGDIDFKELKIPLLVNATNIETGKEVILNKGNVIDAIRTTISLPGLFKPIKYENDTLVDGTLTNPLPLNLLKKYKLDMIICSNVLKGYETMNNNINGILKKSFIIMSEEIIRLRTKEYKYDFMIKPDVAKYDFYDFLKRKEIILEGEKSTKKMISKIKKQYASIK